MVRVQNLVAHAIQALPRPHGLMSALRSRTTGRKDDRGAIRRSLAASFPKVSGVLCWQVLSGSIGADMAGIFTTIKRVLTGEVLHRIDTEITGGWCTMSLRLKRESSGVEYVVLAAIARSNNQYYGFELDEFDRFVEAAKAIRAAAQGSRSGGEPWANP